MVLKMKITEGPDRIGKPNSHLEANHLEANPNFGRRFSFSTQQLLNLTRLTCSYFTISRIRFPIKRERAGIIVTRMHLVFLP